jgi:hypothetical protein
MPFPPVQFACTDSVILISALSALKYAARFSVKRVVPRLDLEDLGKLRVSFRNCGLCVRGKGYAGEGVIFSWDLTGNPADSNYAG